MLDGRDLRALGEMIKGRWREFMREPSAFFFVLFMPLLWMAILGHAFSQDSSSSITMGWKSSAKGPMAELVRAGLEKDGKVLLRDGDEATLTSLIKRGEITLFLEQRTQHPETWVYHFDPANREAGRTKLVVDDLIQKIAGRHDELQTIVEPTSVPGTRYIEFLVPGLAALTIMTSSLFGTGAVIVVSRREQLLKRYLATPLRPALYILSHVIGRILILVAEIAVVLIGAYCMFGFRLAGGLLPFFAFALLGAAAFTAIALLCGSRTSNMAVMNGFTNLLTLPMMIVGGVWFSRSNFPPWLASPARFLPLTALVDGLRQIALEGLNWAALAPTAAVLAVWFAVATVLSHWLFKWY